MKYIRFTFYSIVSLSCIYGSIQFFKLDSPIEAYTLLLAFGLFAVLAHVSLKSDKQ